MGEYEPAAGKTNEPAQPSGAAGVLDDQELVAACLERGVPIPPGVQRRLGLEVTQEKT
jgi:hypothetical protein